MRVLDHDEITALHKVMKVEDEPGLDRMAPLRVIQGGKNDPLKELIARFDLWLRQRLEHKLKVVEEASHAIEWDSGRARERCRDGLNARLKGLSMAKFHMTVDGYNEGIEILDGWIAAMEGLSLPVENWED